MKEIRKYKKHNVETLEKYKEALDIQIKQKQWGRAQSLAFNIIRLLAEIDLSERILSANKTERD